MKKVLFLLCALTLMACSHTTKEYSTQVQVLDLWPDGPAEDNGLEGQEMKQYGSTLNVYHPILTIFPAAHPNGTAILVCPGGAYTGVCEDYEGTDMAPWLNDNGITLAVLRYRMPNGHSSIPLTDALRAMEIMREKSDELGFQRLGIMGFSAGGHLASTVATHYTSELNRPDFHILIYPVISMDTAITHAVTRHSLIGDHPSKELETLYSNELHINSQVSPAFIALSGDDEGVPIANSLRYYEALQHAGVPAVLHMYPKGGHGWGFNPTDFRDIWTAALMQWLMGDSHECVYPQPEGAKYDFVSISAEIPDAILEIRYHSSYNFVGARVDGYDEPIALMTRQAVDSLKKVSDDLKAQGYRIKIFDAYRPQCAVDHFVRWAKDVNDTIMKPYFYPELAKDRLFPEGFICEYSSHTHGSTVDLTLFDMNTEREVDMGGTFDWFGMSSYPTYTDLTEQQLAMRHLLRDAMLRHGFEPFPTEWWHFTLADEPYPDTFFNFPVSLKSVQSR
ncbi:MAG: prolyl oligopeptidase family serine peptidase [Paludibacteraceae bacterium]|nr:prolyl oligopeptidase family serine peptidase [Paludibacteraceae bacterium]